MSFVPNAKLDGIVQAKISAELLIFKATYINFWGSNFRGLKSSSSKGK
jgi:hypothetical protein